MARPHLSIRAKLILSISIPLLLTYLGLLAWDYQHQRDLAISDLKATLHTLYGMEEIPQRAGARAFTFKRRRGEDQAA